MKRRVFLKGGLQMAATALAAPHLAAALVPQAAQGTAPGPVPADGFPLPANFVGLGYEMSSPARLGLLSPDNTRYVNLLRTLGRGGVMRFGGIVADYTSYQPDGPGATEPKHTVVTRAALEQLRAFLDKTGWDAIWSVNFGQGTLSEAIAEARDVARILGPHLLYLELGNEVDNYGRGTSPLRKPPYTYQQYRAEYTRWHDALLKAVPGLRFAAPDTAESIDWVQAMARDTHGKVQLLTTHYYRNAQQQGSADQLAQSDPALSAKLQRLQGIAKLSGISWRMCETNSFSGGGLPGVSDTLLGALWTLDYMLLLASSGCAGVNLETGVNQLGFVSSYSPIQDDGHGVNSAGAPFYGMLAFAQAVQGAATVRALLLPGAAPGATAYAVLTAKGKESVVLINRESSQRGLPLSMRVGSADLMRLRGESLLSGAGITLGGASVQADGTWAPEQLEQVREEAVQVAPGSAVVLFRSQGAAAHGADG